MFIISETSWYLFQAYSIFRLGMRLLCSKKLSIMLLSSAPKITYYAFKKMPIILKIMPLILAINVNLLLYYRPLN